MSIAPAIQSQAHVTQLHFGRGMERASALWAGLNNGSGSKQQHTASESDTLINHTPIPLELPQHTFLSPDIMAVCYNPQNHVESTF
jgi:hypothetical protein